MLICHHGLYRLCPLPVSSCLQTHSTTVYSPTHAHRQAMMMMYSCTIVGKGLVCVYDHVMMWFIIYWECY